MEKRGELLAIRKRLTVARRRAIIQEKRQVARIVRSKMTLASAAWMAMLRKSLYAKIKAGLRGKTAEEIAKNLIDWKWIEDQGRRIFLPTIDIAHRAGRELAAPRIAKYQVEKARLAKDIGGSSPGPYIPLRGPQPEAAYKWSLEHTGKLVVEITENTRQSIIGYVAPRLLNGKSNQQIARDLRTNNVVGLWSKQTAAVGNYWTKLTEGGMSEADADKRAGRYADRLLAYRTDLIARTETSFALNEGIRSSYKENGITHLERVEDPEGDPKWDCDCRENNGKIYTVEEADGLLPVHPACEGTWVIAEGPGPGEEGDTQVPDEPAAEPAAEPEPPPEPEPEPEPEPAGPTAEELHALELEEAGKRLGPIEFSGASLAEAEALALELKELALLYPDVKLGGILTTDNLDKLKHLSPVNIKRLEASVKREPNTWGTYFPAGRVGMGPGQLSMFSQKPFILVNKNINTPSNILAGKASVKSGWHFGAGLESTARHEFAHAIDHSVSRAGISSSVAFRNGVDGLVGSYSQKAVVGRYAMSRGLGTDSYYREALAEMFDRHRAGTYPNVGGKMSPMAKAIKNFMDKTVGKIGPAATGGK